VGEALDGLIGVVLALSDTTALEVVDLDALGLTTDRGVDQLELTGAGDDTVLGTVLVTESVTANDDGLVPARHKAGNAGDDNGLTEDGTAENVTDGTVGGEPHWWVVSQAGSYNIMQDGRGKLTLLQLELLNTGLIGGDGGTLDTDTILLDSLGGINSNLIIGLITVLQTLKTSNMD
jgi:hypothetical protein